MKTVLTSDTRMNIMNLAQELIQTRGFNAFSYQDISDRLKIKKASIHHHFASKDELGAEVYDQARLRFIDWYNALSPKLNATQCLESFVARLGIWAKSRDRICLSGIMNAEWNTLPKKTRQKAEAFQFATKNILIEILEKGRKQAEFKKNTTSEMQALLLMSAAQGALQICRVQESPELYIKIMNQALTTLQN